MKQYKFKYKGRWHDILCTPCGKFKGEAIADTCFGTPDEYHFRVLESSLPKLLATLRKLNIEVAEVFSKLRIDNFGNSKIGFYGYHYGRYDIEMTHMGEFKAAFKTKKHKFVIGVFLTFRKAKAACQADFQKRRAR